MEELELQPGEEIILAVRKHWLVFLGGLIPHVILGYLPIIGLQILKGLETLPGWTNVIVIENPWVKFALGVWWLFIWLAIFSNFSRHYLDLWILTNKRIIDIDQVDFFHRQVSSLFLDRVQDVSTDISGFFETLLGFGTITVESAGVEKKFFMPDIENPKHIRDRIMDEIGKVKEGHKDTDGV